MKVHYTTSRWAVEQKFPIISGLCFRKISKLKLAWVKSLSIHVTEKLKNSVGAQLMPRELNFSSSLSTFNMVASFAGSSWWPLALQTHTLQVQILQKRGCVSFKKFPTKESLYFSDSDWVICPHLNQSLCPEPYNDFWVATSGSGVASTPSKCIWAKCRTGDSGYKY